MTRGRADTKICNSPFSKSKEIYNNWIEKHKGEKIVSGSKTADKRAALIEYFKNDAQIMIATEAAAEGKADQPAPERWSYLHP